MMVGNPVIATNYGGSTDFVTNEVGYPVDYAMTPVFGMPWPMYKGDQCWAEPDIMHARKMMRHVFENQEEAKKKGELGKAFAKEQFSWERVGAIMKARLEAIAEEQGLSK